MITPRADAAAIVVGGGGGERLGGVSKTGLMLGGRRLIDRVCGALLGACGADCAAVVSPAVRVPDGILCTLEDPPSGGPLAGIDTGLCALDVGDDVLVMVVSVDTPGVGIFLPALLEPALRREVEGRAVQSGGPEPSDQYPMGVYRAASLRHAIDEAVAAHGSVRDAGMRRVLHALDVKRVSVSADACQDIDTLEDVAWWETFLGN